MIYNLKPLEDFLLIFQLEGYQIDRFVIWLFNNFGRNRTEQKRVVVWTPKAKFIYFGSLFLLFVIFWSLLTIFNFVLALLIIIILWFNSYLLLIAVALMLKVYELPNREVTKFKIAQKISSFNNLKVIGITGSAGKTSVKNLLHHFLGGKALATPLSFNTLFGIAKAVDYELNPRYQYFICEMGAYRPGEIKELCRTVKPDVGILTTINNQHIERFRSITNTVKAKFEILNYLKQDGIGIINLDNDYIRDNLYLTKNKKLFGYTLENRQHSLCSKILNIQKSNIIDNETEFFFSIDHKMYEAHTKLLGKHHLHNISAAIMGAIACGVDIRRIISLIPNMEQVPHRLEYRYSNGINILDDTYSSNEEGFLEALNVLDTSPGKKILITPGIVELGRESASIHERLSQKIAQVTNRVILVGLSDRTATIKSSLVQQGYKQHNIIEVQTSREVANVLTKYASFGDTVLYENDLPDQYL